MSAPLVCGDKTSVGSTGPNGSTGATSTSAPISSPVDPYYLWHGIVFIALFSVLMPVTAFLILINKSMFYSTHKVLGVFSIILLGVGWGLLSGVDRRNTDYASLAYVDFGIHHKTYGYIGCYVAAGVCGTGVFLWFLRLPKTMKAIVRYIHGIVGGLLAIYGPFVVWTGWIRLAPVTIVALDSTPLVWMSLAIGLAIIYLVVFLTRLMTSKTKGTGALMTDKKSMTDSDVRGLVDSGKTVVIMEGNVCEIPNHFKHPGGMDVIKQYNGKEIGGIMRGTSSATLRGRNKYVPHSDYAIRLALKMSIGRLAGGDVEMGEQQQQYAAAATAVLGATTDGSKVFIAGKIQSCNQINKCNEFPVRLFKINVANLKELSGYREVDVGARMYLSLTGGEGIQRPYTVVGFDSENLVVSFAIKVYLYGSFTSQLGELHEGSKVFLGRVVAHAPVPRTPSPPGMVLMIAGGTGVVPMLYYIKECAGFALGGVLMWWVHSSKDLFMIDQLDATCGKYGVKIKVYYTNQQAGEDEQPVVVGGSLRKDSFAQKPNYLKHPLTGKISATNVLKGLGGYLPIDPRDIAVVMSGPVGFIDATHRAIGELGLPQERVLCLD